MLKSKKVRPITHIDRILPGGTDIGAASKVLVETPTAKLVIVPGCAGYGDQLHTSRYIPVRLMSIRPSGKTKTIVRGGRIDTARICSVLSTICEELKADVSIADIDPRRK